MASFMIPSTYEDASSAVYKVHYIFNLIISASKNKMYAPLVKYDKNEEIFVSTEQTIFPYFKEDRLWFMHSAALQRYNITRSNEHDYLDIQLDQPDIGEDEYFQYSTVHHHEDIFAAMLIAKLNTVDLEQHKYNNKSCKIIIPAFIALYDYIVHKKESTVYDMYRSNISMITGELK